ncbi:hypothetical protein H5410_003268 [Solanum commersonii]|uniref:Uncharacterized protein n=1 Tax=Solanum commersonii TaxID=4109 RepID=A0A9J6B563_SOLCO|nr:hypothetical protein H5410_003268 [Solanum commersonii]
MQLAGKGVLFEDIRNTNPFLYRSCKDILNMDVEIVDQDVFNFTFLCEVESLGSRREIKLCPKEKDIIAEITSIAYQVAYFSKGFSDVITRSSLGASYYIY